MISTAYICWRMKFARCKDGCLYLSCLEEVGIDDHAAYTSSWNIRAHRQLKSLGGARRVAMNSLTNILPRYMASGPEHLLSQVYPEVKHFQSRVICTMLLLGIKKAKEAISCSIESPMANDALVYLTGKKFTHRITIMLMNTQTVSTGSYPVPNAALNLHLYSIV